jgi:hypothetical protein
MCGKINLSIEEDKRSLSLSNILWAKQKLSLKEGDTNKGGVEVLK